MSDGLERLGATLSDRAALFALGRACNYRNYMSETRLKVTRIGNSRGVRLPAKVLRRYGIGDDILMEERPEGILLRPTGSPVAKLSWDQTAREMARAAEDWADWDSTAGDGLLQVPWQPRPARVAERRSPYAAPKRSKK